MLSASVVLLLGATVYLSSPRGASGAYGPGLLFVALKGMLGAAAAASGLFLTADCLSEEKREGTLGLLFLANLGGSEVVLGKLLSTSLRSAYGLLAVFPILAAVFVFGGVTGDEFWRGLLALVNTLFFSLAAGLFVSSISRRTSRAMSGTFLLAGCFFMGPPLLAWACARVHQVALAQWVWMASPGFSLLQAKVAAGDGYWGSTGMVHGWGWMFLILSSVCVERQWRTEDRVGTSESIRCPPIWLGRWWVARARSARLRGLNPVGWLSSQEEWLDRVWTVGVMGGLLAFGVISVVRGNASSHGALVLVYVLEIVFKIWVAMEASRFFIETQRAGWLEMLSVSPLSNQAVVEGHAWGLRRLFLVPCVALLALHCAAEAPHIAQLSSGAGSPLGGEELTVHLIEVGLRLMALVTGLTAMGWFGMWMGLRSKKTGGAVLKTLLFVQILPGLGLDVLRPILTHAMQMEVVGSALVMGLVSVGSDLVFILVSRQGLHQELRELASGTTASARLPSPQAPANSCG